jgi:hypothetical protein
VFSIEMPRIGIIAKRLVKAKGCCKRKGQKLRKGDCC